MDYRTSEKSGCNAFTPVSIIERYEYVYLQIAPTTEVGVVKRTCKILLVEWKEIVAKARETEPELAHWRDVSFASRNNLLEIGECQRVDCKYAGKLWKSNFGAAMYACSSHWHYALSLFDTIENRIYTHTRKNTKKPWRGFTEKFPSWRCGQALVL
jgi:hypothetical protein